MQKSNRKIYKSMRGTIVDMEALRASNEQTVAIGNASMNGRGDIMGRSGTIDIPREQIIQTYYENNPQGVKQVSIKQSLPDTFETPSEAISRLQQTQTEVISGPLVDTPADVLGKKKARRLSKDD